jgi:hypothetical protein
MAPCLTGAQRVTGPRGRSSGYFRHQEPDKAQLMRLYFQEAVGMGR